MRLTSALPLALAVFASIVRGASFAARQNVVSAHGTITAPAVDTNIISGESFAFNYEHVNYCESGYSLIGVYIMGADPGTVSLTSAGEFSNYLYKFGDYLYANFGLPEMSPGPPPASLVAPALNATGEVFLSVIETYRECPGYVALEYGVVGNTVEYSDDL